MFDFEKLDIYRKAKMFNSSLRELITKAKLDTTTKSQLRRAALSVALNVAEGSGRFTIADRRNFYTVARSSIFECVAVLDILKDEKVIEEDTFQQFYTQAEQLSKMLYALIKSLR